MANFERDKEDVRVYDGSEDDEDGEGSHLPVVIIIAILVLAAFGGVVWLAYNQGVARGRNEPVRLAAADTANPGNGIKVYQQPAGAEDDDVPPAKQAEPPKSQPAEPSLMAQPVSQAHAEAAPPKAAVASPPPAALAPAKPLPQPPVVATKPPAQLGLAQPAPEAATPPAKAAVVASKPVAAAPKPAAAAPKAVVAAPPKAAVAVAPKPAATIAKPAPSGSYLLQVGAYKSEAEAMTAWKTYQVKHATLLAGFGPDVQRADLGDKGVWYRLRISSFADKDAATALCERLKAQSGACFLAR